MAERTQPAKTRAKINTSVKKRRDRKVWTNGFGCAVAEMLRNTQDDRQAARRTMRAANLTLQDLVAADVVEADYERIRRALDG